MRARKLFWINSAERVSGSDSDFTYVIEIPKDGPKYDSVVMLDASIPKSYYLSSSGFNTFQLQELGQSITVTLPVGNYSAQSLKTNLQTLLNSASPNHWTYSITFPSSLTTAQTAKYTYLVSGNSGNQPSFAFPSPTTLWEIMGFDKLSTATFVANSLTSSNVIKLVQEDVIHVHSNLCKQDGSDILQHIYVAAEPDYSSIKFTQLAWEANSKQLTDKASNLFYFKLTAEDTTPIFLNGLNWNCCICIYERENIADTLREALKLYFMNAKATK